MRTFALCLALLGAPMSISVARADAPKIHKLGIPATDRIFGEVANINAVLEAAEKRMDQLERQVSEPLGLPDGTALDAAVFDMKVKSKGDMSTMNAGGRAILLAGGNAPQAVKDAAGKLNEGTQELEQIAKDVGRLPVRLGELVTESEGMKPTEDSLKSAGMDPGKLADVENKYTHNFMLTKYTDERAEAVTKRAQAMIGAVKTGLARPLPAAGAPEPAPRPQPVAAAPKPEPRPKPARTPKPSSGKKVSVTEATQQGWKDYKAGRFDEALEALDRAEDYLLQQTFPVQRFEIVEMYQLQALCHLARGEAPEAARLATQALVVYPSSSADMRMGPDYVRLHKSLQKLDIVPRLDVRIVGDGRAYLSGNEVSRGSSIQVGQGRHLLQIEQSDGTFVGEWRDVDEGTTIDY